MTVGMDFIDTVETPKIGSLQGMAGTSTFILCASNTPFLWPWWESSEMVVPGHKREGFTFSNSQNQMNSQEGEDCKTSALTPKSSRLLSESSVIKYFFIKCLLGTRYLVGRFAQMCHSEGDGIST